MTNSLAKHTILIVDDDPANQFTLKTILEGEGFDVKTAQSAKECFNALETHNPDLLILDVMMPDMLGTDLCFSIKSDPQYASILIILISGTKVTPEDFAYGLEIGADDYISRPYLKRELLARVHAVFRLKDSIINQRLNQPYTALTQNNTRQTAVAFQLRSIEETYPEQFQELVQKYLAIQKKAVQQRIYKTENTISDTIREIALDLGFMKANARDVIDLHNATLEKMPPNQSTQLTYYMRDESKIILVELLGNLVNFYRNSS